MTRTVLLFCAAVLLAVGFGMLSSVQAQSPEEENASQFCHDNFDFGLSHDQCVTFVVQIPAAVARCKFIRDTIGFGEDEGQFRNFGQCVIFFGH